MRTEQSTGDVVLLVDDEDNTRRASARALRAAGWRVLEAENGERALELLRDNDVGAVVADMVMPGVGGLELTRRIKQDEAMQDIPVVVVTGFDGKAACMDALNAGAEEFLHKPVDAVELVMRVRNLLRLHAATRRVKQHNQELQDVHRKAEAQLRETVAKLEESRQQIIQSQKMESIGRLAGGVAHDFNNMLTSIICFTRFVVDDMASSDPRRADLVEVLKSADSAAKLTSQLLAFSRRSPVQPSVLDLNKALENVDRVLRRTLGGGIELVILQADEPMCTLIDPGQFDQLIFNLTLNARDAMPRGGTITLKVSKHEIGESDALPPGAYVELSVSDTGEGMPIDVQTRVFEPFFSTKGDKGTGLGLSTCYGIVEQAQGRITLRSREGEGTTFSVVLPRVLDKAAEDKRRSANFDDLGMRGTVLVVDDQPAIQRTMMRAFELAGLTVIAAPSAEDALSLVERDGVSIDLLCTDIILPGMSGINLAQRLRARQTGLPVLFVSGYAGDDPERAVRTDRRTAFVPKPFTGRQLLFRAATLLADD